MKPWGKLELDYINHDKFLALTAPAICLWHEGKNYTDLKHTNGLIPLAIAKRFRFYTLKAMEQLTHSVGVKPGTTECYAALWIVVPGIGYQMHDYLAHNDGREIVLARIAQADANRLAEQERLKAWRARKRAKSTDERTDRVRETYEERTVDRTADETPSVRHMKRSIQNQSTEPEAVYRKYPSG